MSSVHQEAENLPSDLLSEPFLEASRFEADPPADDLVESFCQQGLLPSARTLLASLVDGGQAPEGPIRDAWRDFIATEDLGPVDSALLRRAERVFAVWGTQITLSLCFGSLGGGYAANRISQFLLGVSRLESDPARRVFETAQLLFDALGPGGMEPGGRGVESAQRVRLMHAGVRHTVRELHASTPAEDWVSPTGDVFWRTSWGVPINQEDMLGTILTMSVHVLDCLSLLGVRLSTEDRWAYVYTWLRVARVMGVTAGMIPRDLKEAERLWTLTQKRQFAASPAGVELERVLLDAMDGLLPGRRLRFFPRGLVWKLNGPEVAQMVGVAPLKPHERIGFAAWLRIDRGMSWLEARNRFIRNRLGSTGTVMVRRLDRKEMGGHRTSFAIPESLAGEWALRSIRREPTDPN